MKLAFLDRLSKKSSNIKFNQNLSNGNRVVPCELRDRQTDRRDEANSRFSVRPQRLPLSTTTHHILQYSRLPRIPHSTSYFHVVSLCKAPDNFVPATVAPNYFPQRSRLSPSVHVPSQSLFISFFPFSYPILLSFYPSTAAQILYPESRLLPSRCWLGCSFSNTAATEDIRHKIMQTGNNTY
jgi:hypothetical protein